MSGIYIHIPFCHSKCGYCDFYSSPRHHNLMGRYIDAIITEAKSRSGETGDKTETVYIGGGTPSILPDEELIRLCRNIEYSDLKEMTIEVNPEDIDSNKTNLFRQLGINRVSMGVQALDDDMLRLMGRRHSASHAIEAYHTLRAGGIAEISLDLIYGLPGQTVRDWEQSLYGILELHPEHLSAYLLSYEKGTRFHAMQIAGKLPPQDENMAVEMYDILCEAAHRYGYNHYEISNFALPGHEAVHNSSYWDMTPYIGLGAGAHSFNGKNCRRINRSDIASYIASPLSACDFEDESQEELFNDFVITRLRTARGLDMEECVNRFGIEAAGRLRQRIQHFITAGKMEFTGTQPHTVRITENSWLTSDSILVDLID